CEIIQLFLVANNYFDLLVCLSQLSVCRLLLSRSGCQAIKSWIPQGLSDELRTLSRMLRIVLRYLGNLPMHSPSTDYALPIRCLENVLSHKCDPNGIQDTTSKLPESISWLYLNLARHQYFRMLAQFTDRQVPASAGFLSTVNDPNANRVFDPIEFARPPQTRAFLELILAPVKWASCCSTSNTQASLENIMVLALNDILVSDGSDYVVSERVVRGIGTRLFDSRLSMLALVHTCLSCASDTATPRLIPSINLLYLLITVVLQRLLRGNDSLTSPVLADTSEEMDVDKLDDSEAERPPPMMPSSPTMAHLAYSESAMTGQDSAKAVRCIAWLLIHTLTMPGLPCPRPLKAPAPLIVRSTEDGEQSDSEEDEDEDSSAPVSEQTVPGVQALAIRSRESEGLRSSVFGVNGNAAAYIPTWFDLDQRLHGHSGVRICPLQIEQICVDNRQITVSLSNRYIQVQSLDCPSFLDKCSAVILNESYSFWDPGITGVGGNSGKCACPSRDAEHSRHHVSSD
ncbi:hypothetical protein D915_009873, partial [Fasciola hepatica]